MRIRHALTALATVLTVIALSGPGVALAQTVTTFASGMNGPRSLATDSAGRLYVSVRSTHQILRYSPPSNTSTLIASTGLSDPIDMVFDDLGNLYVADYVAGKIFKVGAGGALTTFATAASPGPMVRDAAGNFYVGEYFNQRILKITPGGVVSTYVALIGASGARLTMLYMDTDGTLYAGMLSGIIYKVGPGGSPVTTFASGLGSVVGFDRGPDGNWLTSTYDSNTIRKVTPAGTHTLYAGTGATGFLDGPLLTAKFNWPAGLIYRNGVVYIADFYNDRVRMIDLSTTPAEGSTWGRLKSQYR